MLHNELTEKKLPPSIKKVLSVCVKIVNFFRNQVTNHCIFKALS